MPVPSRDLARSGLAAERLLLDAAQRELEARRPRRALALLQRYRRLHAGGALTEEAGALGVQVLAAAGMHDAAHAAAAAFRLRYPRSLLGPAVEAASRR